MISKEFIDISFLCVSPESTIRHVMTCIGRNCKGIVLITRENKQLLGTVTDGDIRRAMLEGLDLNSPVCVLLNKKRGASSSQPVTALTGTNHETLLELMKKHCVYQIPIVNELNQVVSLVTMADLMPEEELPLRAVVMAGGLGTRLRPLTAELPKPMLPLGGRPLMEVVVDQLRKAGIRRVNLTTHYKGDIIAEHFGDGSKFGVKINYVQEHSPLGTAGALGLLDASEEPLLVINGDIFTKVDFRAMLRYHREHKADMTLALRQHEIHVPYGVVETDRFAVRGISEKPVIRQFVNAGIYLINPIVCRLIPTGKYCDMTELINQLVNNGHRVVGFPVHEYWVDIGESETYQKALTDFKQGAV